MVTKLNGHFGFFFVVQSLSNKNTDTSVSILILIVTIKSFNSYKCYSYKKKSSDTPGKHIKTHFCSEKCFWMGLIVRVGWADENCNKTVEETAVSNFA